MLRPRISAPIIEKLMVRTATAYGLNTDFEKLVNPTGRFVLGSSFADCGVTGRKLACDTYGGIGHIGGGAMSGKDPTKVDRSGAYADRKIARDIVSAGYADKAEVQIAYAIGVAEPVSVYVETFGTEHQDKNSSASMFVRIMTSHREALPKASDCSMWIITLFPHTGTLENRGFRGRNKKLKKFFIAPLTNRLSHDSI